MIGCIILQYYSGGPNSERIDSVLYIHPTKRSHPNFLYICSKLAMNVLIVVVIDNRERSVECR